MADGTGGRLIDGVEECAAVIADLLKNPERPAKTGRKGRECVRRNSLLPRLLLNQFTLMQDVLAGEGSLDRVSWRTDERDPVYGMVTSDPESDWTETLEGEHLCSASRTARGLLEAARSRHDLGVLEPGRLTPDHVYDPQSPG